MGLALCLAAGFPMSRLALSRPDDPAAGNLICHWALERVGGADWPARLPLAAAAMDWLLGLLMGFCLLAVVAEAGKRVWWGFTKRKRDIMGYGDVKLLAMLGAFFGADACIFILLLASVLGFLYGVLAPLFPKGRGRPSLPFAPFLAAAGFLWMAFGNPVFLLFRGGQGDF